jgi:peptide/nickel transport system ATP-binding protein
MDEPTSALDVVAQRSLMHQVETLRHQLGFAVIFVTHDMSVVSHYSDRLAVMYAGEIVELGPTREVFDRPEHPYSQGLMEAFPSLLGEFKELTGIAGNPPSLVDPPAGCLFAPRCAHANDECRAVRPELITYGDHQVRCHLVARTRKTDA